jgi:hypothetical protein
MRSRALVTVLVAASVAAAAQSPFVGRWKMNLAKSNFGETTMVYEQLPSGEMRSTAAGQSYTFRIDGKDYPAVFGNTVAWSTTGPSAWQTVWKMNGKTVATDTLTLSSDGNALTIRSTGTKPNGDPIDDTVEAARVSGGPGLQGKWKTKKATSGSPNVVEFAASGKDGLAYKVVDMGLTCDSRTDGRDYPCSGPTLGKGWTLAITNTGPRSLAMTIKNGGHAVYTINSTVAADGKTLTETQTATATNEKVTIVYDRQ